MARDQMRIHSLRTRCSEFDSSSVVAIAGVKSYMGCGMIQHCCIAIDGLVSG